MNRHNGSSVADRIGKAIIPEEPAPSKRTHIHWVMWAFQEKVPNEQGGYLYKNKVDIDVIAPSYEEAVRRAEHLCPINVRFGTGDAVRGAGYDLMSAIEHLEGQCTGGHV